MPEVSDLIIKFGDAAAGPISRPRLSVQPLAPFTHLRGFGSEVMAAMKSTIDLMVDNSLQGWRGTVARLNERNTEIARSILARRDQNTEGSTDAN